MFQIKDDKTTFCTTANPAIVFDIESCILLKIGDYDVMLDYFEKTCSIYKSVGINIGLIELPKNQDEIDLIFNSSLYAKNYLSKVKISLSYL